MKFLIGGRVKKFIINLIISYDYFIYLTDYKVIIIYKK